MSKLGIGVVGRNEGNRLRRCLESLRHADAQIVYVDSDSTDDSVALAKEMGADVIELDTAIALSAARARNAAFERLTELVPDLEFVHFFDGDCEIADEWLAKAMEKIQSDDRLAGVYGQRRERHPEKTIYNKLCDMEWVYSWPFGEVTQFGGDVLLRAEAFREAEGYDPTLMMGEEPELSLRLRSKGWRFYRLTDDMTLHDIDMTRFSQWWRRNVRLGHFCAEGAWRYGLTRERYNVRETASIIFWSTVLPSVSLAGAWLTDGWSLLLLAAYAIVMVRIYRGARRKGSGMRETWVYAFFLVLGKFPSMLGILTFVRSVLFRRERQLIEYK